MTLKVKICGLTCPDNIDSVVALSPDYIGFVFAEASPRRADIGRIIQRACPSPIKRIGVFQNQSLEFITETVKAAHLDGLQLHGSESSEFCAQCREENPQCILIKAFGVTPTFDFKETSLCAPFVDYFLFDTHSKLGGGSGEKFNWNHLTSYKGDTPFFLSGGLAIADTIDLRAMSALLPQLYGVDANSRLESAPGIKDPRKVLSFIKGIVQ